MCRDRGQPAFGRRLCSLHQIVAWGNADEEKRKQMVGTALSGIFQPSRMHGGCTAPARLFRSSLAAGQVRLGGNGVVIAGLLLGVGVAVCGLRDFLRFTERKARESERKEKMP